MKNKFIIFQLTEFDYVRYYLPENEEKANLVPYKEFLIYLKKNFTIKDPKKLNYSLNSFFALYLDQKGNLEKLEPEKDVSKYINISMELKKNQSEQELSKGKNKKFDFTPIVDNLELHTPSNIPIIKGFNFYKNDK